MYTCTRRAVAEAVMRQERYERTLAKLQALTPPVLTREQILAALKRGEAHAKELQWRLEQTRATAETMARVLY